MSQTKTRESLQLATQIGFAQEAELPAIWELYSSVYARTYPNQAAGVSVEGVAKFLWYSRGIKLGQWGGAIADSDEAQRTLWVGRQGDEIKSMITTSNQRGVRWINNLYVATDSQGRGEGSRLLTHALNHLSYDRTNAPEVHVNVAPYLEDTRAFYEGHGFVAAQPEAVRFIDEVNPVPLIEMIRPPLPLNLLH